MQFLFLLASLTASCIRPDRDISEPDYNPHILRPARYVPAQGKVINMDSVAKPEYVPAQGKYVKAGQPKYVPAQGKEVNMDSVAKPKHVPAKGRKVPAGWPRWQPAQLAFQGGTHFSHLEVEQGLNSGFVNCLLEDRHGRIWIGDNTETLGVWDGSGLAHYTRPRA